MAEPIKTQTLGGLTYNANQASAYESGTNNEGKKMYTIEFNSGETMTYPEQPELREIKYGEVDESEIVSVRSKETGKEINYGRIQENGTAYNRDTEKDEKVSLFAKRNAEVTETVSDGWIYDDTSFEISNVMGATFTTSKDTVADVTLTNSEKCTVDLSANNSKWYGDNATIDSGKNNTVILDKNDTASINGEYIEGTGEADQKDY